MKPVSLYIHYPFCELKCPYCDFNSHVRENVNQQNFLNAYLKEIDFYKNYLKEREIQTIYFGGGTPSLMAPNMVAEILNKLNKDFKLSNNPEITIEANPSSSEIEKFKSFKQAGINRISIGVQSFDDNRLKFLGRKHNAKEAIKAIESAKQIFDDRLSFDLIYATKNQTLDDWQKELEQAVKFNPKHLSLYQLTIEKGTDFFNQYKKGEAKTVNDDLAEDMYFYTIDKLKQHGLKKYEISNFAALSHESQHNLNYWRYGEYLGLGAGAHSRVELAEFRVENLNSYVELSLRVNNNERSNPENLKELDCHVTDSTRNDGSYNDVSRTGIYNIHSPEKWLEQVNKTGSGTQKHWKLDKQEVLEEMLFMGLRVKEGIKLEKFTELFGKSFDEIFDMNKINYLFQEELLKVTNNKSLKATDKGMMIHTSVYKKLIEISNL